MPYRKNFCLIVGNNIRFVRKLRHMTQSQLADAISTDTDIVTASAVGHWERGERDIPLSMIQCIADALSCPVESIIDSHYELTEKDERIVNGILALSQHEKDILLYSSTQWSGHIHALIESVCMYASLPRDIRQDICGLCFSIYIHAIAKGDIDVNAPQPNIKLVEKEWLKLGKDIT